jgi:hypothetical protein
MDLGHFIILIMINTLENGGREKKVEMDYIFMLMKTNMTG